MPLSDGGVTTLFVGREADGQLIVEAVPDAATVAGVPGPGTEPTSETTTGPATPTPRPTPDPETPLPTPPRVPSVPRGGTGAGLGGLAAPTGLGTISAVGAWFESWFSDDPDAPPAPRMPLAAALAAPEGLRPTGMRSRRWGWRP